MLKRHLSSSGESPFTPFEPIVCKESKWYFPSSLDGGKNKKNLNLIPFKKYKTKDKR